MLTKKRRWFAGLLAVMMVVTMLPCTAFAEETTPASSLPKAENNVIKMTENVTFTNTVKGVGNGNQLTLDLNGFTLTGSSINGYPALWVQSGGTLTIVDSSEEKTGKIVAGSNGGRAIINNSGCTLNLERGTIMSSEGSGEGIVNQGNFIMEDGTIEWSQGSSALINLNGSCEISGGTITDTYEGSDTSVPLILNQNGTLTISGNPTIKSENNESGRSTLIQSWSGSNDAPHGGTLNISGGTFSGSYTMLLKNYSDGSITGGTFTSTNTTDGSYAMAFQTDSDFTIGGGENKVTITKNTGWGVVAFDNNSLTIEDNVEINAGGDALRDGETGPGKIVVNGGTITSSNGTGVFTYHDGSTVTINGGTISGKTSAVAKADNNTTGSLTVTGGAFSSDPADYTVADRYLQTKDGVSLYYVGTPPEHLSGMNTWTKNDSGVYEETYVAPVIPSGGGASSGGSSSSVSDNVTNTGSAGGSDAVTNADIATEVAADGSATAAVDQATADKIVEKAVENGSKEVVVEAASSAGNAETTTVSLPTETLAQITEKTEADVTVKTDVADVTLDWTTVKTIADEAAGSVVEIVVVKAKDEEAEMHFELKVVSDGKVIADFKGGNVEVTVKLNSTLAEKPADALTCVYIDDAGKYEKIGGRRNADSTFSFTTTHFSTYAIMLEEDADKIIAAQTEPEPEPEPEPETVTKADVAAGTTALNKKILAKWSGSSLKLSWGKVANADGYEVYAAKCGTACKKVKTVKGNKTFTTALSSVGGKKISTKGSYIAFVKAYRMIGKKKVYTGTSYVMQVVGKSNAKYTDPKAVKLSDSSVVLKTGGSKKLKVTITKAYGKKQLVRSNRVARVRCFSTNTKVATVTTSGTIKAKAKGACTIYVVAANGVKKTVKVTVK